MILFGNFYKTINNIFTLSFFSLLFLFFTPNLAAQQDSFFYVKKITVEGNKITKKETIFREMTFAVGDTIPLSNELLEINRLRILGLSLFNTIEIRPTIDSLRELSLHIVVTESWYIFPIPIFEVADRNFNVWWKEKKGAISRTNIGLRTTHKNITGRADPLRFTIQGGFTQKYSLSYTFPALNKARTLGLFADVVTTTNKEIWYNTEQNKIKSFHHDNNIMLRRIGGTLALSYRPRLFTMHQFLTGYSYYEIADTVPLLNPNFLGKSEYIQRFWTLGYSFIHDTRDFRGYPRRGHHFWVSLLKNGWSKNEFQSTPLSIYAAQYFPINNSLTLELVTKFRTNLQRPQNLPYNNRRALGFNADYLRGYEYYVIDGETFGFIKSTFRQKLFKTKINLGKKMPLKAFRIVPIAAHLTTYFDTGFAKDNTNTLNNPLNNQTLWSGGVGLDIIYLNDVILQFQLSTNHLKETGLYFHLQVQL